MNWWPFVMTKQHGFTLIEIIIALAIFATIATITSSILYQSFQVQTRVTSQSEQLNMLQLTQVLLRRDTAQFIPRPVRGNEMHQFPAFIGQRQYVEFTRTGAINPLNVEQRSNLKRIAYLCQANQLIRRIWTQLDTPNRDDYQDTILLDHLRQCQFAYLGPHRHIIATWYSPAPSNAMSAPTSYPSAVQLTTQNSWGKMVSLFPLSLEVT